MKIQNPTVLYYVEDALVEIRKIQRQCKKNKLTDVELLVWMEHALDMFHAAFNFRFISREKVARLPFEEWEKYLNPPKELFGNERCRKYQVKKKKKNGAD